MIHRLIELGADTSACTISGSAIFHVACLNGHEHIVKYLLAQPNLDMKLNERGYHPLHYAAGCKRGSFCVELLTSLLGAGNVDLTGFVDGKI